MKGLGFLIWQLANMPPVADVIRILKSIRCSWVSIKVADGSYRHNFVGNSDATMLSFIGALQAEGIEVGGWHYTYPGLVDTQAARANERVAALGLSHYLLDVEGQWKGEYSNQAKTFLDRLSLSIPTVGLLSYRYPHLHPIPWTAFISHKRMDIMTPQVYWVGAHNVDTQVRLSEEEYRAKTKKPFIPIGSAYGEFGWTPTVSDIRLFVDICEAREYKAFGFYSLDYIVKHKREDWLKAIDDSFDNLPTPPIEPNEFTVSNCSWLNGRTTPEVTATNLIVSVRVGQRVTNLRITNGQWRYVGLGPIKCWMHGDYLS